MPDKLRILWERLRADGYYSKSFGDFMLQFAGNPKDTEKLYNAMRLDNLYSKSVEDFKTNFFYPIKAVKQSPIDNIQPPLQKYKGTRDYRKKDKQTLLDNMQLEKEFGEKYGKKNLWTNFAAINRDEYLKDMLVNNENRVDPNILAGVISAEGMGDDLHRVASRDNETYIPDYMKQPGNILDYISYDERISSTMMVGTDDWMNRYEEFKKKGLTKLEPEKDFTSESIEGSFINEKGEKMQPAWFSNPQVAFNAVSSYVKNIENIITDSKVKVTPQEKEQLLYIGYNYGENGLKKYLSTGKNGKDILNKIKEERPGVYEKSIRRVAVANKLREVGAFTPVKTIIEK
jgi:hypothetical protein